MNILYLASFNLKDKKGLGLITQNKINALRNLVDNVDVISSPFSNSHLRVLFGPVSDFKASWHVVSQRPDFVISRGPVGFFTILLAKLVGVKTVREVHAYAIEEVHLLPYKGLNHFFLKCIANFSHHLDIKADLRIFNHPDLLSFYKFKGYTKEFDLYVYNGYSIDNRSTLTKEDAYKKFGLSGGYKYLVFVGSATKWHGVDYIVELQREFLKHGDAIRIVFGGASIAEFDSESICLSFSPLDPIGCADLIKTADLCLLPVRNNRVSPGSPLKLYDYIVNKRMVVAQENMLGYCDEVVKHGVGFCVDFSDSKNTREKIVKYFSSERDFVKYPAVSVSWEDRMQEWLTGISKMKNI